jgi:transaldolase
MELWLDTVDYELISIASKTLNITGITTNPAILAKSSQNVVRAITQLLDIQNGLVAVQVIENSNKNNMLAQAQILSKLSDRVIIKVPVTQIGLSVIKSLSTINIPTMATAIYEPCQVLLAGLAGAKYAAPYVGRINDNPLQVVNSMQQIINSQNLQLKLIAAAIRSVEQIISLTHLGIDAITVSANVYQSLLQDNPQTHQSLKDFEEIWNNSECSF